MAWCLRQFTIAEDNRTYDLSGQTGPLMEILQILKANGIGMNNMIDLRSNPAARQQVQAVVRRAARGQAAPAGPRRRRPPRRLRGAAASRLDRAAALPGTGDVAGHRRHLRRGVHRQAAADHRRL